MSKIHQNINGLIDMCDNGYVRLSDCPSFECRPICYVDKKATGAGDGSSWENAYTDIQTAINANSCKEIQIKGYGENDCYPAGIQLSNCAYLKGIDAGNGALWIEGNSSSYSWGISGSDFSSTKLESINIVNCGTSFSHCFNLEKCKSYRSINFAFSSCKYLNECGSFNDNYCYNYCQNIVDCTAHDSIGIAFFRSPYITRCSAISCAWGYYIDNSGQTLIDCVASGCSSVGFFVNSSTLINCLAENNGRCGFTSNFINSYINCQDVNNCLVWGGNCTGQGCDEV